MNQAVLKLLRRGAGIGHGKGTADTVGASLDHLIGTWTPEEADEMDKAFRVSLMSMRPCGNEGSKLDSNAYQVLSVPKDRT